MFGTKFSIPIKLFFKENLVFFILLFCSAAGYVVSVTLWPTLSFSYTNPYNAVGKLSEALFNPLNNYVRWAVFILMPSIIFLVLFAIPYFRNIFMRITVKENDFIINKKSEKQLFGLPLNSSTNIFVFLLIIFTISLLTLFFCKDFTTANFDMFHEGEQLSPAINYLRDKSIWSRTLFVHGAGYDLFTAVLSWKLFGAVSIGAYRVLVEFLKLLTSISFIFLITSIWYIIKDKKVALLITQSILFSYFLTLRIQNFDRRTAPLLIGLSALIIAIQKKDRLLFFITGLFSSISAFYTLDIGLFFSLVLFILPVVLYVFKYDEFVKFCIYLFTGVVLGWLCFFIFIGNKEFSAFLNNLIFFLRTKDLIDSYVYPLPNIVVNPRFAIPLILSGINIATYLVLFIKVYFRNSAQKNIGIIHCVLLLISLIFYRSALGRSDLTHVEYSSSFLFIVLGFGFSIMLVHLFSYKRLLNYISYILFFSNTVFIFGSIFTNFNFYSLTTFSRRVNNFVNTDNISYINEHRKNGVIRLQSLFSNEQCLINLTSEAALNYLLNKPSCGRIYISYFASADPVRAEFLNDIKYYKPKYVVFSSKAWTQNMDGISNEKRFPVTVNYIKENYKYYETVSDYWEIYKLKDSIPQ